jgi:hypothetical protein
MDFLSVFGVFGCFCVPAKIVCGTTRTIILPLAEMRSLFAFLFLLLGSNSVQAAFQCSLSEPISLHSDGVVLEQVANRAEGIFTMRVTYTGGQSWVGIGINSEGQSKMLPATAVIGRAFDSGETSVLKYDLTSDNKDASGVVTMSDNQQTLQDAIFTQTETESVLQFTQYLNEPSQVVTDESLWIFAVGLPDNEFQGKHTIHGSFRLSLTDNCILIAPETPQPTPTPTTPAQLNLEPTGSPKPTMTSAPTSQPTISFSPASSPTKSPISYSGANSGSLSSGIQFVSTSPPNRSLWVAHGVLMAIAWGICAPCAVGVAMLRNLSFLREDGRWCKLHLYLNILTTVLTIIGFILAVVATSKDGDEHFEGEPHKKVGLAILILVVCQSAAGYFRPGLPKKTVEDQEEEGQEVAKIDDRDGSRMIEMAIGSSSDYSAPRPMVTKPALEKSLIRLVWEPVHRLLGMALLGLAWYNCHSGIQLQVENYGEKDDLTGAFWGVTAGISGMIFLLKYVLRL